MFTTTLRLVCRSVEDTRITIQRSRAMIAQSRREREAIEAVLQETRAVLAASRRVLARG